MLERSPEALLDLLQARSGLVCAVGAGGKKTTLYRLMRIHPGRAGLSATVFTLRFPRNLGAQTVIEPAADLRAAVVDAARRHRKVAFAQPSEKRGRVAGPAPDLLADCHRAADFDVTLVKADGARMRPIKAPSPQEPVVPPGTVTVLYLVSALALGQPLDDSVAHRPQAFSALTGLRPGEPIQPLHVARLLGADAGAFQHVGDAHVIPIINAVEDSERLKLARRAAEAALTANPRLDRVVLAAMRREPPVREVLWRD